MCLVLGREGIKSEHTGIEVDQIPFLGKDPSVLLQNTTNSVIAYAPECHL